MSPARGRPGAATAPAATHSATAADRASVYVAAAMEAARFGDDGVALGVCLLACRRAGTPLDRDRARELITLARQRRRA